MINDLDIQTRALYNRVMVQLGLAAFRRGLYTHAVHALTDLQQTPKIKDKLKELLGQVRLTIISIISAYSESVLNSIFLYSYSYQSHLMY